LRADWPQAKGRATEKGLARRKSLFDTNLIATTNSLSWRVSWWSSSPLAASRSFRVFASLSKLQVVQRRKK
jgi:hypothetical protein